MWFKKSSVKVFLTDANKQAIMEAIAQAEQNTSGEVRVHIEPNVKGNSAYGRAVEVFEQLGMTETEQRNGMLVYVALDDRQFAIIGDEGIHAQVGDAFWDQEKEQMVRYFAQGDIIGGIVYFIGRAGEKLKAYFPYQTDDKNELSNEISVA